LKTLRESGAVTPQCLASSGQHLPKLIKGAMGDWRTEKGMQDAIAQGRDTPHDNQSQPMHAGKIGMLGTDWYGRLELKPDGRQHGENRKILEEKIHE
jgi:hypothetical protein